MGDIINLKAARKARARDQSAAQAAENRARFGRTRTEKAAERAAADALRRTLDQARREE